MSIQKPGEAGHLRKQDTPRESGARPRREALSRNWLQEHTERALFTTEHAQITSSVTARGLGHDTAQNANSQILGTDIQTDVAGCPLCKFHCWELGTRTEDEMRKCAYSKECISHFTTPTILEESNKQVKTQNVKAT